MRIFGFFKQGIGNKTIFAVLIGMVILHLILMLLYVQYSQHTQQELNRKAVIEKIINTIHIVAESSPQKRKQTINAVSDSNMKINITKKPEWNLTFNGLNFFKINQSLQQQEPSSVALSIKLRDGNWLNFNATIYTRVVISQLLLVTLEFIMVISILIAALSIYTFTKPLEKFKLAAERLGVDLHSKPIMAIGPTIVRETADAMNKMQERIQELIRNRTLLLAAISHDLRTPITRMKLREQFNTNPDIVEKNNKDLTEMEAMIAEILEFAKQSPMSEKKVKLDLLSLLQTIHDEMQDLGYSVTLTSPTHKLLITGRSLALKRAFTNIIGNAIKYGKRADIDIKLRQKHAVISVKDNGPGIPKGDQDKIFDPFYRGETSRSRDTGGSGLGLALTRDIIIAHRGKIEMTNLPEGGLKVTVILPVK